jgi:propanol-preferring alcohol dehydrogenase
VSTYRVWEVTGERQFRQVERERRDPLPGEARLRVLACGVCHTDTVGVEGLRPDPSKPVVPGHEIVGVAFASYSTPALGKAAHQSGRSVNRAHLH